MSTRNRYATLSLLILLSALAIPTWAKTQKTKKPGEHPINNIFLDKSTNRTYKEDGAGGQEEIESKGRSVGELTDRAKKETLDAVLSVFGKTEGFKKVADATVSYNCHGLTFKNRAFWLGRTQDAIDTVLKDQGWMPQLEKNAKKGDIVIYRLDGKITHSGIILEVKVGKVTSVQSKWGPWGEFIHAPNDVPRGQAAFAGVDYGTYEVWSGGDALPPSPPESLPAPQDETQSLPWPAEIGPYSMAPVDTVITTTPRTVQVGETFQLQIHVMGKGVGSFVVPISYSFSGGDVLVYSYGTYPPQGDLSTPTTDVDGLMTVTAAAMEPGLVTYTVVVDGDDVSGGGSLQVLP